jgi:hypothetical protein
MRAPEQLLPLTPTTCLVFADSLCVGIVSGDSEEKSATDDAGEMMSAACLRPNPKSLHRFFTPARLQESG